MSRPISSNALTEIAKKTGTAPINIIAVEWVDGTYTKYADKTIDGIDGLIITISSLDEVVKLDTSNTVASISVTLDDSQDVIKGIMDQYDIHKRNCIIYQYFEGLALSDAFELFRGQIHSPISWSEGQRTVSFTVASKIFEVESGFAPEEGQFQNVPLELTGQPWPLCFGSPMHVPAVKASQVKSATVMSIGGIQDATLLLKKEILRFRLDQITEAYNYYQQLIAVAQGIEVTGRQLQEEYCNFIIGSDTLKQTLEDLTVELEQVNFQIEELIKQYNDLEGNSRTDIKNRISTLVSERNKRNEVIINLREQLELVAKQQDIFEIRNDNLKFEITFINRLRKKCFSLQEDYIKFTQELTVVNQAISQQGNMCSATVAISGNNGFPLNQVVNVTSNNVVLSGIFTGSKFTINNPQPNYRGLVVAGRQSEAPDTLWLSDSSINLTGMYLYSDTGYIARVVRQEGNKVQIQLPKKNRRQRNKARSVDYSNDAKTARLFDATLSRLLTGNETATQIAQIANQIPKGVNPFILNKLRGKAQNITIELKKADPDQTNFNSTLRNSSFQLQYGDFYVTEPINFTDTEAQMKQKLIDSTDVLPESSVTFSILETVSESGTDCATKIRITFADGFTPYDIQLFDVNLVTFDAFKRRDSLILKYEATDGIKATVKIDPGGLPISLRDNISLGGKIDFYFAGKAYSVAADEFDFTAQEIVDQLVSDGLVESGEITGTGQWIIGSYYDNDLEFQYTEKMKSIYIDVSNVVVTGYDEDDVKNKKTLGLPRVYVEYEGFASENTKLEIQKILEENADKIPTSPGIKKFKEKILELMKQRKEQLKDGEIDSTVDQAISKTAMTLSRILQKVKKTEPDKLYERISDREYSLLYDMELSQYLQFIAELRALDQEFVEDDSYEFTAKDFNRIDEVSPIILPAWLQRITNETNRFKRIQLIEALPRSTEAFYLDVGSTLVSADAFEETYVANILPSTVLSVYAHRSISGVERFVPVPSSYYTVNESDSYGQYDCTTITLAKPLKWFDSSWSEGLFVSLTSSVGDNVVDVIEWLITTYTNLTVDTTSFDHVKTLQTNYPVNFALLSKRNTLQLVEDIAWQARCSVWIARGKVYIRYLPEAFTPVKEITESDVDQSSLELSFTDTEQLVTKYTANWRQNYEQKNVYSIVVRRNVKKYEEIAEARDFFIYNNYELVYKSITFWMIRRASTWKKVSFSLFLNHLDLESQDVITLNFANNFFTDGPINAVIEQAVYQSDAHMIDVTCWLPVLANERAEYKFAWPKDLTVTDLFPLTPEVTSGNAGNPINVQVPSGEDYDPLDPTLLDQRPKDFGLAKIGDSGDTKPLTLASELTQFDYDLQDISTVELSDEEQTDQDNLDAELEQSGTIENSSHFGKDGKFGRLMRGGTTLGRVIATYDKTIESSRLANNNLNTDQTIQYATIIIAGGMRITAVGFDRSVDVKTGDKVLVCYMKDFWGPGITKLADWVYWSPTYQQTMIPTGVELED